MTNLSQQDYRHMAAYGTRARLELNELERILNRGIDPDTRELLNHTFKALAVLQDRCYDQAMPRPLIEVLD